MSWKSPGAVRAAGYAACMCSPCCPQLKLFQEPYVLAYGNVGWALKPVPWNAFRKELSWAQEAGLLKEELAAGSKVGWTGSWNMPTQSVNTLTPPFLPPLPFYHFLFLLHPTSMFSSLYQIVPSMHISLLHLAWLLLSIFLPGFAPLGLMFSFPCVCIRTHYLAIEWGVEQITGATSSIKLLLKDQYSICLGFSPCGATYSSRYHGIHGPELLRWKRTRTARIAGLTLEICQACQGGTSGQLHSLLNSPLSSFRKLWNCSAVFIKCRTHYNHFYEKA